MSKCQLVQTTHVTEKNTKRPLNIANYKWIEEGTPLYPEKDCTLHTFLLDNGFLYVPSGFFVFANEEPALNNTNEMVEMLKVSLVAMDGYVIRVLPEGYKPCAKTSRRYQEMKALQPSPHVTVKGIVLDDWKLKGRAEVLKYTIDMVDGGVYHPEGVVVCEHASLFMAQHFDVIAR